MRGLFARLVPQQGQQEQQGQQQHNKEAGKQAAPVRSGATSAGSDDEGGAGRGEGEGQAEETDSAERREKVRNATASMLFVDLLFWKSATHADEIRQGYFLGPEARWVVMVGADSLSPVMRRRCRCPSVQKGCLLSAAHRSAAAQAAITVAMSVLPVVLLPSATQTILIATHPSSHTSFWLHCRHRQLGGGGRGGGSGRPSRAQAAAAAALGEYALGAAGADAWDEDDCDIDGPAPAPR